MRANYRFKANIRLSFSHTGEYFLQNIRLEENIRKTLSEFRIQWLELIFAQLKLSYFQMHPKATMAVLTLNFFSKTKS